MPWANSWNVTKMFFSLGSYLSAGVTYVTALDDGFFSLDGSNDADSRNGVRFGGFVNIPAHLGVQIPPPKKNTYWGSWIRRFTGNRAKYWNFHFNSVFVEFTGSQLAWRLIVTLWDTAGAHCRPTGACSVSQTHTHTHTQRLVMDEAAIHVVCLLQPIVTYFSFASL